ncbi:MAG: tryptophan--tRNA ligase [Proteobacteria bacterium]|nr:tryptophan--tRNA ligase [Pseudomonadota bacterium]
MSERSESTVIIHDFKPTAQDIILTGDRPTGPLHLGHYHGSLKARVRYQHDCRQYILVADVQALTDNAENPEKVRSNVLEVMLDYLAVGIDPNVSTIYIASAVPETAELTLYYMNLVNLGRLQRNPTVKTEMKQKGFDEGVPVGFVTYPINQAADISQFKATIVPVGEDQVPMIEQTNDIVRNFNRIYKCAVLRECKALVPTGGLLPGIDGSAKMSKSLGNAVYLSDDEKTVAQKIKMMFTDPKHLRMEDPGTVEGNVVFSYLDAFDPDTAKVEELKAHYRRGGLGDGVVKQRLREVLEEFLKPIRARRAEFAADKGEVLRLLKVGTERARAVAAQTLKEAKEAMGINYF